MKIEPLIAGELHYRLSVSPRGWGNRLYSMKLDKTTIAQQLPIEFTEQLHQWDPAHTMQDLLEMSEEQKQKYKYFNSNNCYIWADHG